MGDVGRGDQRGWEEWKGYRGRAVGSPQKGALHVWGLVGSQLFWLVFLESMAETEVNTEAKSGVLGAPDPAMPEGPAVSLFRRC